MSAIKVRTAEPSEFKAAVDRLSQALADVDEEELVDELKTMRRCSKGVARLDDRSRRESLYLWWASRRFSSSGPTRRQAGRFFAPDVSSPDRVIGFGSAGARLRLRMGFSGYELS